MSDQYWLTDEYMARLPPNFPKSHGRPQVSDWFRGTLQAKGIPLCIPDWRSRNELVGYDKRRYRRRSRIEIVFGRLKNWRRVATRYDRCPAVFLSAIALSAIALAATIIFYCNQRVLNLIQIALSHQST